MDDDRAPRILGASAPELLDGRARRVLRLERPEHGWRHRELDEPAAAAYERLGRRHVGERDLRDDVDLARRALGAMTCAHAPSLACPCRVLVRVVTNGAREIGENPRLVQRTISKASRLHLAGSFIGRAGHGEDLPSEKAPRTSVKQPVPGGFSELHGWIA
jgi:hypothetical protein